jgi:2'-5' RNA ligase
VAEEQLAYVHDARHRFSYELRPEPRLDAELRAIAYQLEHDGLLEPGATSAPRFHPHITLLRAAHAREDALDGAVAQLAGIGEGTFDAADAFGAGRIVYVTPADETPLRAARAAVRAVFDDEELDPVVHARPWTPHITLAYAVPEPARAAALARVRAALPVTGALDTVQIWDLDVRPTRLVAVRPLR